MYEEARLEKARIEGVITGLTLAMELSFDPGCIIKAKDEYESLLNKVLNDPEKYLAGNNEC
jgi:hypothetical protein